MVFHMNSLNDSSNPESRLNYYHRENIQGRQTLEMMREEDGSDKNIVIVWEAVWPYLCPSLMTGACM